MQRIAKQQCEAKEWNWKWNEVGNINHLSRGASTVRV